tara:strand:+ start:224 stop:658 length:435 start_codon:yes stop_codon:yes gene_type:complete
MSKQSTIKINKSLDEKMLLLNQRIEDVVKDRLFSIADKAIYLSPVDTGAYVESFSMLPVNKGGGRAKRSDARTASVWEGTANRDQFTEIARSNLYSDIEKYAIAEDDKVVLRNRSPHATDVENGGPTWRRPGYKVFTQIRNIYG